MTTAIQNEWAQKLEESTQVEIRMMAEYCIDHLDEIQAGVLRDYLSQTIKNGFFNWKTEQSQ